MMSVSNNSGGYQRGCLHDGYATDFYGTWDGRDLHLVFNHIGIDAFKAPPAITEEEINRELPAAIERTRI